MGAKDERIAIYSRKSKFTGKGESIGNQIELCRAYVGNVFGEAYAGQCLVFEDEGFSGGNLKRPDFQRMMQQVRRGGFKAIVVYRLDRISRNISDFTGLIDELNRLGVSFVSIREQFDTGTPMGRAMMFIISVFSQLERETIAERIRDNMHELAKTGRWLGGNAPTGFCSRSVSRVTLEGKTKKACELVPIPGEMEIPKMIFDLYEQTDSLTGVEEALLRRGVKTRQGKAFTRFAIKGILQNPVYMTADREAYRYFTAREADVCAPREAFDGSHGIMAYNRTDQKSGSSRLLPVNAWIIAIGRHPGQVPSGQWIRAQQSLERNKSGSYRKPRTNEALLTGLLRCACGARMYPKLSGGKTSGGAAAYVYVCREKTRSKGQRCRCRNVNGRLLDAAVAEQLALLPEDRDAFLEQLETGRSLFSGEASEPLLYAQLRSRHSENEKSIRSLLDALAAAEDSPARARILERIGQLTRNSQALSRELQALEKGMEPAEQPMLETLPQRLGDFSAVFRELSLGELRQAVGTAAAEVVWDGENARVFWAGRGEPWQPEASDAKTHWGEDSK